VTPTPRPSFSACVIRSRAAGLKRSADFLCSYSSSQPHDNDDQDHKNDDGRDTDPNCGWVELDGPDEIVVGLDVRVQIAARQDRAVRAGQGSRIDR
jgi:hypothetical protein